MTPSVRLQDVQAAARRLRRRVLDTPTLLSHTLSEIHGCELWLKFENLQFTASFKERGALNKLLQLSPAQLRQGVLAVSAGNHAQGVAYHARELGALAAIVMPEGTPEVKVRRTRDFGAEVILHGESFDTARDYGRKLAEERGLTLVHPYDDAAVIAGQGTVALEMLRVVPRLDILVVPVGGGGLISGIAVAAKSLRRRVHVLGVEASAFPAARAALAQRRPAFQRFTVADGIAVRDIGALTLPLMRRYVDDIVLVPEYRIENAIAELLEIEKTVVEGAGAVGLAAVAHYPRLFRGKRVGIVLSGGNIDPMLLSEILRRVLARSGRLVRIAVSLPDRPSALGHVSEIIGRLEGNIETVEHERTFAVGPVKYPQVHFTIQTRGSGHARKIVSGLRAAGYPARARAAPDAP